MAGYESQLIMFLMTSLSALLGGIIRYLLKQIEIRDSRIASLTESSAATNKINEQLAALYLAQLQEPAGGKK
jgi:hypothetical protein